MATQLTNYQCPACTGPLHFDGASGKLVCDFCGSSYDTAEIEAMYAQKEAAAETAAQNKEAPPPDSVWSENEAAGLRSYSCPSCGAELICDETTAATSCPYCGNPTVIAGQFSGMQRPELVLPFVLDKNAAKATTMSAAQFMGVPVDGSTKMPNGHMDAIEPYDYRAFQPFSTAYLPGYMADKYDEDADTCQARAHSRMQNSVSSELSASITGYNSVSTLSENISIDYTAKHYALLPVWMLHTKWQGKDYLFAMNGQTGKLVGDLPVDKRKVAAWFAGISVPLMILLAFLL